MSKRTVSILTFIILSIMIALLAVFMKSQTAYNLAQEEAIALVEYDHQVKKLKDFYWTTTDQATFALNFFDENNQQFYAIIERDGGDIQYYTVDELFTEDEAKSVTASQIENPNIMQARLGLYKSEPVWEMTLKNPNNSITYYLLSAKTGEWIQTISNI
ncbi:hypothetical protein [Facklamia miroungae]|uniref:Uncharacterized protein YpmB n=1 Tax=Facklamia miroungae TaxID=120956 RepID=A0A1G7PKG6_9LACT|nr:hypothetical protein [Facklamia miroungae]NKZ28747.1 hypothetical protein [Facklamia miroungae]SDF86733.1 Uncharacterized protein YpmB [Facklamia miroungae]